MMEKDYLLKGLELYKSLIDKLAIVESDEPIPLDEVGRKVQYLADQKHMDSPLAAWDSMNESQKMGMALLLKHFSYVNYHDGISTTLRELSEAEIKIDGIELPKEPYNEFMFYDFISRSMGYDWPEELGSELREKLKESPLKGTMLPIFDGYPHQRNAGPKIFRPTGRRGRGCRIGRSWWSRIRRR